MKAIRTIYGPNPVPIFSLDIEITVNVPEAEEVAFNLVSNKNYKVKDKASFFSFMSFSDSRSKTSLILQASSLPKARTTYSRLAMMSSPALTTFI